MTDIQQLNNINARPLLMSMPTPFPLGTGVVSVHTRDHRTVLVRHIQPGDDTLLVDLFHHLSQETRRLRFFTPKTNIPDALVEREAYKLANINMSRAAALIAVTTGQERTEAVADARLVIDRLDPQLAEMAIVVRDDYQHAGLGSVMYDLLIQIALVRGLRRLRSISMAENDSVHRMLESLGLPMTRVTRYGVTTTEILLGD